MGHNKQFCETTVCLESQAFNSYYLMGYQEGIYARENLECRFFHQVKQDLQKRFLRGKKNQTQMFAFK